MGEVIALIVPEIRRTSDLIQEIAAASREQAGGITEIGVGMGQLERKPGGPGPGPCRGGGEPEFLDGVLPAWGLGQQWMIAKLVF